MCMSIKVYNNSYVKMDNVEITNSQMKKCTTQQMDPILWEIIHCFMVYCNLPHSINSRKMATIK